jgi:hypothetical protein
VQHAATLRIENNLDMRDLQARANPGNTLFITRNEMRSADRIRSSALSFSCKTVIRRWLSVPTLTRLAVKPKACWARVAYLSRTHQRTGDENLYIRIQRWSRSSTAPPHDRGEKNYKGGGLYPPITSVNSSANVIAVLSS